MNSPRPPRPPRGELTATARAGCATLAALWALAVLWRLLRQ